MPPLNDPQILEAFRQVLLNWNVTGYVTWKDTAREWIAQSLEGVTLRIIARLMHEYVQGGGTIDQVRERRSEWNDRDYHYDFRLLISGRLIYIETILIDDDPDDPTIHVVSVHHA